MKSRGSLSPPSHHPHQTPSLCPFRADVVITQVQVLQSRVLFEAFGQGLTVEICRAVKARDEGWYIMRHKVWFLDGFGMQYVSFNIKFAHICSRTALERYLPKKNLNPSQSDHLKTTCEESQCIYILATLRSTEVHFAMLSFQRPWTFHWLCSSWIAQTLSPLSPPFLILDNLSSRGMKDEA